MRAYATNPHQGVDSGSLMLIKKIKEKTRNKITENKKHQKINKQISKKQCATTH